MFHYGWTNIDILDLDEFARRNCYAFVRSDVMKGFPNGPSDTVDLICASHIIEHLNDVEGLALLKECRRILRPGGLIRVSCPDAQKLYRMYNENRLDEFGEINGACNKVIPNLRKLQALLYDNHKMAYDEELLIKFLKEIGFKKVQRRAFRESSSEKMLCETLDMHPSLSIYVEAIKD
jgi:predicted SAM-dependent methyltransferase